MEGSERFQMSLALHLEASGSYHKDPSLRPHKWVFQTIGGATGHLSPQTMLKPGLGPSPGLIFSRWQAQGGQRVGETGGGGA